MFSRAFRAWRRVRSRWSQWSATADREFHDHLFAAAEHDPFSPAYPGYLTIRRFADLAAAHLENARLVLDLGCGPGEITCELAKRFPALSFHGVDHSQAAVDRASSHAGRLQLSNVTFQRGDLQTFEPVGICRPPRHVRRLPPLDGARRLRQADVTVLRSLLSHRAGR